MGEIRLQMIDSHISSHWWQELVKYFVNVGNSLEIRCWKEESEEIQQALQYGNLTEANYVLIRWYVKGCKRSRGYY